jgi:acyl-CoA reductase-like NAD-dependent aldehyde dehydrogenase
MYGLLNVPVDGDMEQDFSPMTRRLLRVAPVATAADSKAASAATEAAFGWTAFSGKERVDKAEGLDPHLEPKLAQAVC